MIQSTSASFARSSSRLPGVIRLRIFRMHEGRRIGLLQFFQSALRKEIAIRIIFQNDVEQQNRHARIGDMCRNLAAHNAGTDNGDFFDRRTSHYNRLQNRRDALPAADTLRCQREFLALAFQQRSSFACDARACRAQRMPERNRAAVEIYFADIECPDRGCRRLIGWRKPRSIRRYRYLCTVSPARCKAFLLATTGPMPMISGAQPPTAIDLIRARMGNPLARAYSSTVTKVADAPSVKGEDVAAVTVPFSSKAGFSSASFSAVVPGRMHPSLSTTPSGDVDRHDFIVQFSGILRGCGLGL